MRIEIFPLDKVVFDGVSVCLGMERTIVEDAMGIGQHIGNRFYYYNNELAIDYNKNNKVEFIEFLGGVESSLQPTIYGLSVFGTDAEELKELLKQKNGGDINDTEQGYCYSFENISVGVYREIRPSDVLEMIEEMKVDGISTEDNEDVITDMYRASHWGTIGVGIRGYYQR